MMKQTVRNIIYFLTLVLFLIYSSGLKITIHHCCHKHHHEANDHRHCTENTYVFKITDQFKNCETKHVAPVQPLNLLGDNNLPRLTNIAKPCHSLDVDVCHCLFHLPGRCIFSLVSHFLL